MDGEVLRRIVLEIVAEMSKRGASFQASGVLGEAARRLGIGQNVNQQQALLTFWSDLFRTGYVAWGYNLANPSPPFCHLTEQGRRALAHLSRDPSNPEGYLQYLLNKTSLSAIAISYTREALNTFNAGCFKASAVMIGVAAEDLILNVRDVLVARMNTLGQSRSADLMHWSVKQVLDSIETTLHSKKGLMPKDLIQSFEAYWPAFTQQIRTIRNDAGHPNSVDPVQQETVHASLLLFPELATVALRLQAWISASYV